MRTQLRVRGGAALRVAEAAVEGARRRVDVAEGAAAHGTEVSVVAAEVVCGVAGGCGSCC